MRQLWKTFVFFAVLTSAVSARAEPDYVGAEVCLACHGELKEKYAATVHGRLFDPEHGLDARMKLGCEACHGPGGDHVEAGGGAAQAPMLSFSAEGREAKEAANRACLDCHRGGKLLYWEGSTHPSRGAACTSCHSAHAPASEKHQLSHASESETCAGCHGIQRSRLLRNSRMPLREGHMECSSCHNPHGSVSESLIHQSSVNENCNSCHADKRGPFLFEHAPVTESCLNCHDPHGSSKRAMLKLNQPRLCQQCHVSTRHPSDPRDPSSRFVVSGACSNCHVSVHGSNHPAGYFFSR